MPAPPLSNTLEGGSNGTGITAANSGAGSGDAFSAVSVTGGTLEYSNVQARDTLSARIAEGGTPGNIYVEWTGLGNVTGNLFTRFYLYLANAPTSSMWLGRSFDGDGTAATNRTMELRIVADGSLRLQDQGGLTIADIPTAVSTGAWHRVETRLNCGTSAGEMKVFSDPDSTTPSGTASGTGTLAADQDHIRLGVVSGASSFTNGTLYMDNLALSTTDWVGPAGGAPPIENAPEKLRLVRSNLRLT